MGADRPTDRLFIGAFPDPATARDIADLGGHLKAVHRLGGRPLRAEHIHSTLWHVYDGFLAPPPALIDGLMNRLAAVDMAPFLVSLNRVMSFRNGAFVLFGDDGVAGLELLHERLKDVLVDGLKGPPAHFKPHVTLLRDPRFVPEHQLAAPIEWEVRELVLVHSLLGRSEHRHLARLPLARRATS